VQLPGWDLLVIGSQVAALHVSQRPINSADSFSRAHHAAAGVTFATAWGAGIVNCKRIAPPSLNTSMQVRRQLHGTLPCNMYSTQTAPRNHTLLWHPADSRTQKSGLCSLNVHKSSQESFIEPYLISSSGCCRSIPPHHLIIQHRQSNLCSLSSAQCAWALDPVSAA
jgi:hypothetical protein